MPARKKSAKSARKTSSRRTTNKTVAKRENEIDRLDKKIDKFLKKEELVKAKDKTLEFLKENPIATIALSAAIGAGTALIINALTTPRPSPREKTLRERIIELLE